MSPAQATAAGLRSAQPGHVPRISPWRQVAGFCRQARRHGEPAVNRMRLALVAAAVLAASGTGAGFVVAAGGGSPAPAPAGASQPASGTVPTVPVPAGTGG